MPIDEILEMALTMFATVGYDGMSLRTLNRDLGVGHNLIYQRFGTKAELWRAAVDFGFGRLMRHMEGLFDPTLSEPLEQLRLAGHRFVVFSADHPELVALMNTEGRRDTDRLAYIYDAYIEPMLADVARLLVHLADEGVIRPIPLRTFHFLLAHGATAPHALVPLATKFDATSLVEPGHRGARAPGFHPPGGRPTSVTRLAT
jgi:AcrR family transcriptional regulator